MQKPLLRLALFIMAALLIPTLSACGDDDDPISDNTQTSSTENSSTGQTDDDDSTADDSESNGENTDDDDDDVPASLQERILGTWEGCVDTYNHTTCTITFKSNSTFSEFDVHDYGTIDSDGTYTIEDGILTLNGDYSQLILANSETFVVRECTSEHLVLWPFYAKLQWFYDYDVTLTRK